MLANWRGVLLLFSFGHFLDNTHKLLLCVNARLGVDALDMGPNGVFRQDEVFRDVASRTSTGQIAQNLISRRVSPLAAAMPSTPPSNALSIEFESLAFASPSETSSGIGVSAGCVQSVTLSSSESLVRGPSCLRALLIPNTSTPANG